MEHLYTSFLGKPDLRKYILFLCAKCDLAEILKSIVSNILLQHSSAIIIGSVTSFFIY